MKLAVITDNTAYLDESYQNREELFVLDIPIIFENTSYIEGKTIDLEEFYAKMRNSKNLPHTSQPNLSELVEVLNQLQNTGYTHVIGLFLSSGISGFWQNIQYLPDEYPGLTIAFPDSKITSRPLGYLVETVFNDYDKGSSFSEIVSHLSHHISKTRAYIMVDDLNHLVKGGRLSNGSALIGNLLNIKPILYFDEEGKIVVFSKVRTEKKALKSLVNILENTEDISQYHVVLLHSKAEYKVLQFKALLETELQIDTIEVAPFSAVIATHLGEGAIAVALSPK